MSGSPLRRLRTRLDTWRSPIRRFVVADRSMEPTLVEGQGLIAVRSRRAQPGQLRCVEHPDRPDFWLVKRVIRVPTPETIWVESDNRDVPTTDSRTIGAVDLAGSWRVIVRIPPRLM